MFVCGFKNRMIVRLQVKGQFLFCPFWGSNGAAFVPADEAVSAEGTVVATSRTRLHGLISHSSIQISVFLGISENYCLPWL
jgi:hypothetical protein